jgi:RNA polymerase sigma-70 factor (ECF subfamily)
MLSILGAEQYYMRWYKDYKKNSDEELMFQIGNGDNRYIKELYNRYSKRLLHYFYRMLGGDEAKAQDFLQDVFLKIIDKPKKFNQNMKFSTWIFTIASNLCKNEYRRLKVRETTKNDHNLGHHEQFEMIDVLKKIDQDGLEKAIQAELRNMDPVQSATFVLRFQENLSIQEISHVLNCAPGTVKSRIFYITKKLGNRLKEFNPNNIEELADGKKIQIRE